MATATVPVTVSNPAGTTVVVADSTESEWFKVAALIISALGIVFFGWQTWIYSRVKSSGANIIDPGDVTAMLTFNIIMLILSVILFAWALYRIFLSRKYREHIYQRTTTGIKEIISGTEYGYTPATLQVPVAASTAAVPVATKTVAVPVTQTAVAPAVVPVAVAGAATGAALAARAAPAPRVSFNDAQVQAQQQAAQARRASTQGQRVIPPPASGAITSGKGVAPVSYRAPPPAAAPTYQAPVSYRQSAPAPTYQAPAPSYRPPAPIYQVPAPSYRQPAPTYQAPAYQQPQASRVARVPAAYP